MIPKNNKIESNLLKKVRLQCDEKGFTKTVIWVIGRIFRAIQVAFINPKKYYILEKNLSDKFPYIQDKLDNTYEFVKIQHLEQFKEIRRPWRRWLRRFEERLKRGQTCIACFYKEGAIGYIWISLTPETDKNVGLTVRPKENESYGFDLYVVPEYREFLIGFELISQWLRYSKELGRTRAIGIVAQFNKPMWMTMKLGFGFKIIKRFHSLEFFKSRGIIFRNEKVI
jgi:GNAT superfamily N-acetyltransferase